MNQFFFESRGKEKVNDLMHEGMMSQAHNRSRSRGSSFLSRIPKISMVILAIVWILQMIIR
jgi:hypothetical protein